MFDYDLLFAVYFLPLGLISGFFAGLFGIGGGMITVPMLFLMFDSMGFSHASNYHLAVGTSLCVMAGTSLSAARGHYKRLYSDWPVLQPLLRLLIPGVFVGCLCSRYLFAYLPGKLLNYAFISFLILSLIRFISTDKTQAFNQCSTEKKLSKYTGFLGGLTIGVVSPLLGIGGGTMTVPFLHYYQINLVRSISISCGISFIVAVVGTLNSIYAGWHQTDLPGYSLGYVYWPAALGIGVVSLISVRLGVFCAHYFSAVWLRRLFILLLGMMILKLVS